MTQSSSKTIPEIEEIVKKWWSALQFERKCSSTNTVNKIVSCSSEEIQQRVRDVIAEEIKKVLVSCLNGKDVAKIQVACNAINGCFDNFIHAVDAVRILFPELIAFIDEGFDQCQSKLLLKNTAKNSVLELLHSLSRILILILKLKRKQKLKENNDENNFIIESAIPSDVKQVLSGLTVKIGNFLMMDEILIDTKNNLSMSGVLIREILISNKDKLIQFHKNFLSTISPVLYEENFKLDILKFLISSAIINTWSVDMIDNDATYIYLKFFISLCENYSSETPVILNTSRTLLLLIKHESFKNFIISEDEKKVNQMTTQLLSCVFMLLEHPVACVRHSAKDFVHLLAMQPSLQSTIIDYVLKISVDKRSYYIAVGALANEVGSRVLIQKYPHLPEKLFNALKDPTIVSHVSLALEFVILNDYLGEKNFSEWCEAWIVPLLISIINVLPIVAAEIDKLLEKAFKKYPNSVVYVTNKWAHPKSGEEIRYVITALKISHKQGFKIKGSSSDSLPKEIKNNNLDGKLINDDLLRNCLHQRDDDIRISAFSLLIEAHKSTKPFTQEDLNLIKCFLKYNLNNQQPATRQKILGLIRKMLVRFNDSKAIFLKPGKTHEDSLEKNKNLLLYEEFFCFLIDFCFSNIFFGSNFNRLNTVLNILILCFENLKGMEFDSCQSDYYWSKLLIALDSSYEENKEIAVSLSRKLNFNFLSANKPEEAKKLYTKAFAMCGHMEPPDVLTGSYLLLALTSFPSSNEVLSKYFCENEVFNDVNFCCIRILVEKLKQQLLLAKIDLMTAATCGPMYGMLFAIRLIFKGVSFPDNLNEVNKEMIDEWRKILNDLVEISFEMTKVVGCVVNSSSPEGHLPMDFQTDFENILAVNFREELNLYDQENSSGDNQNKTSDLLKLLTDNFMKKYKESVDVIQSSDFDSYESLRNLKCLLNENKNLIKKMKTLCNSNLREKITVQLEQVKSELEKNIEELEKKSTFVDWPATAQVLLLCAWRSIKEASLYLGDFVTKLPLDKLIELRLLTKETVIKIGEELKILLCEIKHRGAFEHAYLGFTHLANSLWKSSDKTLSHLPQKWLEEVTNELESPRDKQKLKLCSTRRSAGLPFLVQALICSEIVSVKSTTPSSLHATMKSLLKITENGVSGNPDSKIHALNILRALFKHAQFGEHVAAYVSRALMVAIRGSRAPTWSERNSSNLLFSSLIIRIFGVARSKDEISKKNRMTSRTFFQRYPELYDFLLSEMKLVYSENFAFGFRSKPSLFLVLLVLGRLYPPPTEDPENIDLSEFVPYINMSRRNPTMKIRELGATALVSLIPTERLSQELDDRFSKLSFGVGLTLDEKHGILLQIKALISESVEHLQKLQEPPPWVQMTKWMLQWNPEANLNLLTLFVVLSTYVKVLHIFFKNCPSLRQQIKDLILNAVGPESLLNISPSKLRSSPGVFLFLENFCLLKTDILGCEPLDSKGAENFRKFLLFMLKVEVCEVRCISLRILNSGLMDEEDEDEDFDAEEFCGIGAPVKQLAMFQTSENVKNLKTILSAPEIIQFLLEKIAGETFESPLIHRLWLSAVSTLLLKGFIPVNQNRFVIDFAKSLLKSTDKEISTNAFICCAIYLMEELQVKEGEMKTENRLFLSDIIREFSDEDADVRERSAVAKILNKSCQVFLKKKLINDPAIMSIWMAPLKLLADEDPKVRSIATEFTQKIADHLPKDGEPNSQPIWLRLPSVSLRAQELLLDSYINILKPNNLVHLVVQMITMAMSAVVDLEDEEKLSKDEFGVFEKGNPNPFCETLALSDLICEKLTDLRTLINFEEPLEPDLVRFICENFNLEENSAKTLLQVVETIDLRIKDTQKGNIDFSLPQIQIRRLREAIDPKRFFSES